VLYHRSSHTAKVARIDSGGSLVVMKTYGGTMGDWTQIVESGNLFLFYNRDSCTGAFVSLADDGTFPVQIQFTRATIGCANALAARKRRDYIFYNSVVGLAYFANVNGIGDVPILNVHEVDGFAAWTHIAGTSDLLFFYNRPNHQPYIGQWDAGTNTFTNVRGYQPGDAPDFSLLAATNGHIVYYNDPRVHAGGVWKLNGDGTLTDLTKF
jgi:hypothetical protein